MAIVEDIRQPITRHLKRTWRINIESPFADMHTVQVYRETIAMDADDNSVGEPVKNFMTPINRTAQQMAEEADVKITMPDGSVVIVSAIAIMLALPEFCDRWAQQDDARAATATATRGQES